MVFQCINIRQVPWEVLKTAASGLVTHGVWRMLMHEKNIFDPYIATNWLLHKFLEWRLVIKHYAITYS